MSLNKINYICDDFFVHTQGHGHRVPYTSSFHAQADKYKDVVPGFVKQKPFSLFSPEGLPVMVGMGRSEYAGLYHKMRLVTIGYRNSFQSIEAKLVNIREGGCVR